MLFNSPLFLLAFLPAALVLHGLAERFVPRWRLPLIVLLSFLFYASWDVRFVPLLAASILLNWLAAEVFGRTSTRRPRLRRDRAQPAPARGLQVPGLLRRPPRGAARRRGASLRPGAADRHLVLHLPAHHVPVGPEGGAGRARQPPAVRLLRRLLPPRAGRPARALDRDRPAGRRTRLRPHGRGRALRPRADAAHGGARQEGLPGRPPLRVREPRLRQGCGRARPSPSPRPGRERSATRSSSTSTSRATPTWRSASPSCSASCCRRTSTHPTAPCPCRISGAAGT